LAVPTTDVGDWQNQQRPTEPHQLLLLLLSLLGSCWMTAVALVVVVGAALSTELVAS